MTDELAPLVLPDPDDAKALRFDALLYGIELAYLAGKKRRLMKRLLTSEPFLISSGGVDCLCLFLASNE